MYRNKPSIGLAIGLLAIAIITMGLFGSPLLVGQARADEDTPTDHSLFPQLAGPFENSQEVTQTCLQCHPDALAK